MGDRKTANFSAYRRQTIACHSARNRSQSWARYFGSCKNLAFAVRRLTSTFYEYIKSLRKLGTPFRRGEIGLARRGRANYSYYHVMELALALTLRVYHVVPDTVLAQIIRHRSSLYRHYRRAYTERCSGLGTRIKIHADTGSTFALSGVFLDLQINFSGGRLVSFGPPKVTFTCRSVTIIRGARPCCTRFSSNKLVEAF